MKIFFSLFLLLSFHAYGSCEFRKSVKSVYSLSGPVTRTLEEIGILASPVVKGISVFYPVKSEKTKITGGIFLAPGLLEQMKDAVVFYDESLELKKLFSSQKIQAISLVSRGKSPGAVMAESDRLIRPFLSECGEKLSSLSAKISQLESVIEKKGSMNKEIIFFLGEVREGKLPELVIANDGIAKWLKDKNLVSGYPSEFAYVNWSAQVLSQLSKETLYLGLKESMVPQLVGKFPRMTLKYPGALMPGMTQLEAWIYFLDHIPRGRL